MSGSRITRLAVLSGVLLLALDLAIFGQPTALFDIGFIVICTGAALAVRPRDFFFVGILPPLLLLGLVTVAAAIDTRWVAAEGDGRIQAIVSGLAPRATALLCSYLLTLVVLGIRTRVRRRRLARRPRSQLSNLDGSPAPARSTTGVPAEKSTTVVGSDPHSPESMTASSH